ncbi:MAG: SDR family NAD(P)-dependent oxidoreductase [Acidimicrobiia bacterium]
MARSVAVVTGASAGIGKAFATKLAAQGHDLVVVARDTARLEMLGKELDAAHGTNVEVLTADLSAGPGIATVEARLVDARPVDLLVNNAGFGTMGMFHDLPIAREISEIGLNVVALTRLTHAALEGMVARRSGGVINVASIAGFQPTPGNATYGATKAFVHSFSQAIHEELRSTGVRCMVLCPGFTRTEFQARAGIDSSEVPEFLWQTPETVVDHALAAYAKGRAVCVPGPLNRATAGFSSAMPSSVTRKVANLVVRRAER